MRLIAFALILCSSCSWIRKDVPECAKVAASERAPHALPIIADILVHGSDWKAEVAELAVVYGKTFVDCLVAKLFDQWDAQLKSGKPGISPDTVRGHSRAREWMHR